ncbi:hypothetical protein EYF80_028487 [Liparis tanakae]|uniref:Uncharacterized protein n=1 Tax=Liparis tanakae TaxID=230148 RepID=A0A4Z2H8T7_9TELE|nr:hypothetical protein EYF80_028487 [Liparis tanakae]
MIQAGVQVPDLLPLHLDLVCENTHLDQGDAHACRAEAREGGRTRANESFRPCSHSTSPSAVESGIWQRRLSLSSMSMSSSTPRRSSSRCSTRRPPRNGEVGDWQSYSPLE